MANSQLGEAMNLGWFIAISITGFSYGGYKLDQYVESIHAPVFVILGAFLSFATIGLKLYYFTKKLNKNDQ